MQFLQAGFWGGGRSIFLGFCVSKLSDGYFLFRQIIIGYLPPYV